MMCLKELTRSYWWKGGKGAVRAAEALDVLGL